MLALPLRRDLTAPLMYCRPSRTTTGVAMAAKAKSQMSRISQGKVSAMKGIWCMKWRDMLRMVSGMVK